MSSRCLILLGTGMKENMGYEVYFYHCCCLFTSACGAFGIAFRASE